MCLGDSVPIVESRGSLIGGVETKSSRRRSSLQTFFADFDCRNDQNLKNWHNLAPDSSLLISVFHSGG